LNPYFEHKKMNPNFNLFTGSAKVHLGGTGASQIELLIGETMCFVVEILYLKAI